jgi:hypothetical protein
MKNINKNVKAKIFKGIFVSKNINMSSSFSMTSLSDMKKAGELAGKVLKNIKSSVKEADLLYF